MAKMTKKTTTKKEDVVEVSEKKEVEVETVDNPDVVAPEEPMEDKTVDEPTTDEEPEKAEEQKEAPVEEASAPTIVEVEEPKKEEEVVEVTPIQKKEAPKGNVRVRLNKNHHCFIGGEYYNFTKGNCYLVPENVKCILNKAGLLAPL